MDDETVPGSGAEPESAGSAMGAPMSEEEGDAAAPAPAPAPPPAQTPAPAVAATTAAAGAQADAVRRRWEVMGVDQRLTVAGGVIILVGYLAGVLFSQWGLGLASTLTILATIVVLAVTVVGTSGMIGLSRTAILRIDAGIVGGFAFVDVGDLIDGIGFWDGLDILLTIATSVGALLVLVGVWRMTRGDIVGAATSVLAGRGRELPERLLGWGAAGVLVAWFILTMSGASYSTEASIAILLAVLVLSVLWLGGSGASEGRLPIAANLVVAALAILSGIVALVGFVNFIGILGDVPALGLLGGFGYVAAAAAMVAGALLGMRPSAAAPSA